MEPGSEAERRFPAAAMELRPQMRSQMEFGNENRCGISGAVGLSIPLHPARFLNQLVNPEQDHRADHRTDEPGRLPLLIPPHRLPYHCGKNAPRDPQQRRRNAPGGPRAAHQELGDKPNDQPNQDSPDNAHTSSIGWGARGRRARSLKPLRKFSLHPLFFCPKLNIPCPLRAQLLLWMSQIEGNFNFWVEL